MWTRIAALAAGCMVAQPAELVLRNGKVVTLDPARPQVSAIAVGGGRITALGSDAEVAREIQPSTRVIDLAGRLAVPGFIEAHGHFTQIGEMKMNLNLTGARNWEQIVAMVGAAAKEARPGEWILGRGWHQEKWDRKPAPEARGFPTHESLSKVSPANPVFLTHASGHGAFVNGAALQRAGIARGTPDPAGGEILRDAAGNPTGFLSEKAQIPAREVLARDLARRSPQQRETEAQRQIDLAAQEVLAKGVTSFQDAGSSLESIERLKQRAAAGTLPVRLWMMVRMPNREIAANLGKLRVTGYADNRVTVRAIKRQIDGALGSRGAWLEEPYADLPSWRGLNTEEPGDIEQTARIAIENGFQLAVHAIGDRANRETLDLFERVFRRYRGQASGGSALRWRIEHAQHLNPADIPRFARLGVIASMQGVHATSDAPMVIPRLGPKRAEGGAYAWRSLIAAGAHLANGTDAPVEDVSPIHNFYASVTRRREDGAAFFPQQRMTRMEALRSYTAENAYAAFEEHLKGALRVGLLGDITVLSQDILTAPEEAILKTQVDFTIVGGKVAFERQ